MVNVYCMVSNKFSSVQFCSVLFCSGVGISRRPLMITLKAWLTSRPASTAASLQFYTSRQVDPLLKFEKN